jgi:hypothetical protein
MTHDSTWLGRTRVMRRTRLTAPPGALLACALLACALLAALPAAASATAPEMRGEWELVLKSSGQTVTGQTLISDEANAKGEFASHTVQFDTGDTGTFSGTLEGSTASVIITTAPFGPYPEGEFVSNTMTVEAGASSLALSGEGVFTLGVQKTSGTLTATRLRTYKQIEEQEAREKQEQEEREARARVRGEWALTIESGPQTAQGTALITKEANTKNEFASSSALFESVVAGAFSGTLEGNEASVTVTTQAAGPYPATTFTGTKIVVAFTSNSMSMTGSGTLTAGESSFPATLTATRIKTYQEVKEREAKEKQEKEALEAQEKAEREAKEKAEREAKEKAEREATEKAEREAKEKAEREAREAAEKAAVPNITTKSGTSGKTPTLVSVQLAGKTFTVGATELLSLQITNPNPYAISGRVTLLVAQAGRAGKSSVSTGGPSKKAGSLGTVSFGISSNGEQRVKLKLSQRGRAELTHHKTLHVVAVITTQADGQTMTTKTFSITLHAAKPARSKH